MEGGWLLVGEGKIVILMRYHELQSILRDLRVSIVTLTVTLIFTLNINPREIYINSENNQDER